MIPVRLDFECWTNSEYTEELHFNIDGGVDITGYSFRLQAKVSHETTIANLTLDTVVDDTLQGFYLVDAANGVLQVRILKETLAAIFTALVPSVFDGDQIGLVCDLVATLPDGDNEVWGNGYVVIKKGVTNA
jgi:hypothetical protein